MNRERSNYHRKRILRGRFRSGDFPIQVTERERDRILDLMAHQPMIPNEVDWALERMGLVDIERLEGIEPCTWLNRHMPFTKPHGSFNTDLFRVKG